VDKNQYDLFLEILRRLDKVGVLSKVVLIGSWCLPLYRDHYSGDSTLTALRTRDIDFLVSRKEQMKEKVDLPKIFEDLGFIEDYKYPQGFVKLVHPELIIEFLVAEKGRGSEEPFPLPYLSMNAQRLRFLDLLEKNTIVVIVSGIKINVPHPINYGLHKLIISSRRNSEDKKLKDIEAGLSVLNMYVEIEGKEMLRKLFKEISQKQKKNIIKLLEDEKSYNLLEILNP
jgi:hypothetical protein